MFEVVFFATGAGNEPVLEWLRGLGKQEKAKIGADLRTVQFGFPIGMPLCRSLGDGLFELRTSLPSRKEARLIFFQHGEDLIVVAGFIKKTMKTPGTEIEKAKVRRSEYRSKAGRE
ncbi:MAG: type II toxin-antitoxin system RelE/ParE family toxin [Rhizobiaceae bacterium]